jgi:hypothetical protein
MTTKITARVDVYTRVTNQIVEQLERGVRPWMRPWNAEHAAGRITRPLRHNGENYHGINIIVLWIMAEAQGSNCPYWRDKNFTDREMSLLWRAPLSSHGHRGPWIDRCACRRVPQVASHPRHSETAHGQRSPERDQCIDRELRQMLCHCCPAQAAPFLTSRSRFRRRNYRTSQLALSAQDCEPIAQIHPRTIQVPTGSNRPRSRAPCC